MFNKKKLFVYKLSTYEIQNIITNTVFCHNNKFMPHGQAIRTPRSLCRGIT